MLISKTVKINQTDNRVESVSCGECKGNKNHKILVSAEMAQDEDSCFDYQVIQCLGCNRISFRHALYEYTQYQATSEKIYPDPKQRLPIEGINLLKPYIQSIYKETLKTINNNQVILFGTGIRTILEAITQEQKTPGIDLNEKINNLVKQGLVTQKDVGALHDLRRIGNEATHSITPSSPKEIKVAMDVIEHLLQRIYILPHNVKENLSSPLKNKPNTK
ncbi:DUF4145 domain-containing protein [Chamaesiphon polymorphus]|uniref:DUF4145 domain-containing protein n=1 Tax=Chamaesiphon polymorphus CCALA 037 TaxID=2107692 RepID=A0A2T1GK15_9CYAN|nr:DUF4145 domain-containing protein [Chamaesiphon polymorphus]PSB58039.1 hypothetical protein C7B77_06145 [Chamaesiphon polymorphus CCALA 037]